jgi:hypothetical protein
LGEVPGKPDRLDTGDADGDGCGFSNRGDPRQPAREPSRKVDQIEELRRNLCEQQVRSKDV